MIQQTTYTKPHIKVYPVVSTEILAGSDPKTKTVSVGGDTEVQLSKPRSLSFDISE